MAANCLLPTQKRVDNSRQNPSHLFRGSSSSGCCSCGCGCFSLLSPALLFLLLPQFGLRLCLFTGSSLPGTLHLLRAGSDRPLTLEPLGTE